MRAKVSTTREARLLQQRTFTAGADRTPAGPSGGAMIGCLDQHCALGDGEGGRVQEMARNEHTW